MKKFAAVLLTMALASTSAHAWGPREQGIVAGAAGLWMIQKLTEQPTVGLNMHVVPNPVYVAPPNTVYMRPAQQYCETHPVQNQFGEWQYLTHCYYR